MYPFIAQFAILALLVSEGLAAPSPLLPVQRSKWRHHWQNTSSSLSLEPRARRGPLKQGVSHAVDWPHTNGLAG